MDKRAVIGLGVAAAGIAILVARAKGAEPVPNGNGNGSGVIPGPIPGPITFSDFHASDFPIVPNTGWWGTTWTAPVSIGFSYYTEEAIPEEPTNNPRLLIDVWLGDGSLPGHYIQMIGTPTEDYIGPFQFPAGLTTRYYPTIFSLGNDPTPPYQAGDILPVTIRVEAELAGEESLGGYIWAGQVQCLG